MVFSPLIAATATFALKAGLWFRRGRLAMVFSSLAASCCCYAENPLIPAVQVPAATSFSPFGETRPKILHLQSTVESYGLMMAGTGIAQLRVACRCLRLRDYACWCGFSGSVLMWR
jgi:hypothetical protein